MRSPNQSTKTRVDAVQHYYALSVSFTRNDHVELRLTRFVKDPRMVTTTTLGVWEGKYVGALDAMVWLQAAVNRWSEVLVDESREESGQLPLPGLE